MITAASLLAAIDLRRADLNATYQDVADAIGCHPALFSRLKRGALPSATNLEALVEWIGDAYDAHCGTCGEEALAEIEDDDVIDPEQEADETPATDGKAKVYAINAVSGRLSESDDPDTQAAVARVRELLTEGAVGVSVLLDLHPDDAAILGAAEKAADADGWSKPFRDYLPSEDWNPRQRIRHTAVVDTPAYDQAKLAISSDGTLSGPVTYEGIYTGDVRYSADPENIVLEESAVPSPIIWDREDGDHTGMVVGYIDAFERVEITDEVAGRPVLDDEAITAALAPLSMPAAYFAETVPTGPEPIRISQPDKQGYRVIRGLAAPKGVCHRSSMKCFTFPQDPDPKLRHFHTGNLLRLDDGRDIRVGALTLGGAHLDPLLAKQGVKASATGNHHDDANRILALIRAWPTRFGLMIAGVVPPDVTEGQVTRALACSPSVELWPIGNGQRTLVGIHLVPTPAWPVMSAMEDDEGPEIVTTTEPIVLEEATEEDEPEEAVAEVVEFEGFGELTDLVKALDAKIDALSEIASTILALTPIEEIELPEE